MSVVHLRPVAEQLLTKQQLARHLGRSPRWVELKVAAGMPSEPPTARYPGRRFRLSEVEGWLADGARKERVSGRDRLSLLEVEVARLTALVRRLEEKTG